MKSQWMITIYKVAQKVSHFQIFIKSYRKHVDGARCFRHMSLKEESQYYQLGLNILCVT